MANNFDPNAYLSGNSPQPQAASAQPATTFDPNTYGADVDMDDPALDLKQPATGDMRPSYANGDSPDAAINRSPVSIEDRFKMSVGNMPGKLNYLKKNYQDAAVGADGNLKVKDNGKWYAVDPNGLGDADAWSISKSSLPAVAKELVSDAVDLFDVGTSAVASTAGSFVGASAGVTGGVLAGTPVGLTLPAAAAGGMAGYVGGAGIGAALAKKGQTVMGKLFGTYDATPEEQAKELSMEMLLNMGGATIPAFIKPTAAVMGTAMKKAGSLLGIMDDAGKATMAAAVGSVSGVGSEKALRYMDRPQEVSSMLLRHGTGNVNEAKVIERMVDHKIDLTGQIAKSIQPALSKMYKQNMTALQEAVPESIHGVAPASLQETLNTLVDAGLVKKVGKSYVAKSRDELIRSGQGLDEIVGELVKDQKNHDVLKEYVNQIDSLFQLHSRSPLYGKQAVEQMVNVDKQVRNTIKTVSANATDMNLHSLSKFIRGQEDVYQGYVDSAIEYRLKDKNLAKSVTDMYANHKAQYRETLKNTGFLVDLAERAGYKTTTERTVLEKATSALVSGAAKNRSAKGAVATAIEDLAKYAPEIEGKWNMLQDVDTAQAFVPKIRNNVVQWSTIGGVGTAIASGNPAAAAIPIAVAGLTSPRLSGKVLNTAARTSQVGVKALQMGREQLLSMTPKARFEFMKRPEAVQTFIQTIMNTPDTYNMIKDEALNQGQ